MSTAILTDKDLRVREAVMRQLGRDSVDASAICVSCRDGAVALTGSIGTYAGKLGAGVATIWIGATSARLPGGMPTSVG